MVAKTLMHIINLAAQDFVNALKHTPANNSVDPLLLESITTDVVG
jgi:hypothetical protein